MGAITSTANDRSAHWSAEDLHTRMEFALRCGYAHGTRAIRTHLDSAPPQDQISWPVFSELRSDWAERIGLQAVSLLGMDTFTDDATCAPILKLMTQHQGILGAVTTTTGDFKSRLTRLFKHAEAYGLPVDFHVDETLDPTAETLRILAQTVIETNFPLPMTVGHCCSLTTQDQARAFDTLDLVARAGINVVSLPMCNLYLQDRHPNRTPRYRGITLVHEMRARGINVSFASDNTRDPFYAYGDLDMLEVLREATRIGHLDHSEPDWARAVLTNPAQACGFDTPSLQPGSPADMIIFSARNWNELLSRPQSDRIVLRNGHQIDRTLPSYAELDGLKGSS